MSTYIQERHDRVFFFFSVSKAFCYFKQKAIYERTRDERPDIAAYYSMNIHQTERLREEKKKERLKSAVVNLFRPRRPV